MSKFLIVCLILLTAFCSAFSKNYIGAGASYSIPAFNSADVQGESFGGMISFESRRFCNLWYGLRINYYDLDSLPESTDYYKSGLSISPYIRYAFVSGNEICGKIVPFVHIGLNLSGLEGTYKGSPLGLGGSAGLGAAFPFEINKAHFSIDFMADITALNLLRSTHYPPLYLANVSLMLSIGL